MTEEFTLIAQRREVTGKKVRHLRREGLIPAVLYGRHISSLPLSIPGRQLETTIAEAGSAHLIKLYIDGQPEPRNVLLRHVQRDSLSKAILHADLYEVSMTEKISTEIPIVFTGECPLVERGLGVLLYGLSSVEVECLPSDLVDEIVVDLSALKEMHQVITAGDLQLSAGLELLTDPEEMVVAVVPAGREEEEVVEEEVVEPTVTTAKAKAEEEE